MFIVAIRFALGERAWKRATNLARAAFSFFTLFWRDFKGFGNRRFGLDELLEFPRDEKRGQA
jgi:hypothetical protein